MDDDVSQAGNTQQAGRPIEVGEHRPRAVLAPEGALFAITDQRENVVVAEQAGQQAARDITATDDQ